MADFLLELRSEEIPARMQDKARADLARLFAEQLAAAGLKAGPVVTYATPRRLTLIARDLPLATEAVREELKGPPADAPDAAIDGFLRKAGVSREALETRADAKGRATLFAVIDKPGRATADVLASAIPAIVRAFPWPKSMRWGAASLSPESLRWVRPLQGIVAILGDDLVPCEIAGVQSGYATIGHRFHHAGEITIGSAADYVDKLRACHVIVDQDERRALIRHHATALAADAGLELIDDEGLVAENAGLTEWPVPLLGRFDEDFLSVPPEVIQLTARVNQKYFVCRAQDGALANAFVCVANIEASDGGAKIVEGNRKVLAARLSDARFFYETDLKVPLEEQARKLEKIVFHEKLGTVADKVERVAKLARWLVEEGIISSSPVRGGGPSHGDGGGGVPQGAASLDSPLHRPADGPQHRGDHAPHGQGSSGGRSDPMLRAGEELSLADMAERAARLAKADLVTGMVGEFPELQGLMGGYYAAAQGEPAEVAEAVRDHYKPVGQGDDVPTAPVTVAVSLADKLDTIAAFFAVDEKPTGSKDPFALRRAALGVIITVLKSDLRFELLPVVASAAWRVPFDPLLNPSEQAAIALAKFTRLIGTPSKIAADWYKQLRDQADRKFNVAEEARFEKARDVGTGVVEFLADRLKVQQREAGVRHDLIDAVFALGGEDDLVRLLARVHALQAFIGTGDGINLLAGYKRAANILKKEGVVFQSPTARGEGPGVGASPDHAEPAPDQSSGASRSGNGAPKKPLSYTPELAEDALIRALDAAEPKAAAAIEAEDFEGAMAALASLRGPIDAFFDGVTVNDPDPDKRAARLALLARMRAAVHRVADFSKIEG